MSQIPPDPEDDDHLPAIDAGPLNVATRFGWDAPARIQTTAEIYSGTDE